MFTINLKVILIDNTVSSVKNFRQQFEFASNHTTFLVSKNNTYGRMNKGAGMLDSLKLNREIVTDYDLIFTLSQDYCNRLIYR